MNSDKELREKAQEIAKKKADFYTHFGIYIAVNILIIVTWAAAGGFNHFPWFIFPLFGWGIGIVAHYLDAFRGKAYVDKLAEKEYYKLKNKQQ